MDSSAVAAAGVCAVHPHACRPAQAFKAPDKRLEVADIFRQFGEAYRSTHTLLPSQARAFQDILDCRTAVLGGRLEKCVTCGYEHPVYCSCCNRHCPKCQMLAKAKWLKARSVELLPAPYFHAVFTLPHVLNPLLYDNQRLLYELLFACLSETLQEFAADPQHGLGGKLGFTAILHTWDQRLNYHVHAHVLIPAGVLSAGGQHWVHARPDYLFNVRALSLVFRGKYHAGLKTAFAQGKLRFSPLSESWREAPAFSKLLAQLYKTKWDVYLKPSRRGPQQTLDYLGRYTHRIAISNSRLLKIEQGRVHFLYRDRRDGDRLKAMDLPAQEFIRRFLQHVLPQGFKRLRHFGFLANGCKKNALARCRELLGAPPPLEPENKTVHELMKQLTGAELSLCPRCHSGRMRFVRQLLPARSAGRRLRPPRRRVNNRKPQTGDTS